MDTLGNEGGELVGVPSSKNVRLLEGSRPKAWKRCKTRTRGGGIGRSRVLGQNRGRMGGRTETTSRNRGRGCSRT